MAKKKPSAGDTPQDRSAASYYQLHTKAVDDLVNTDASNAPEYSKEELNRYRGFGARFKLSEAAVALLVKAWFAGSVCFFIYWGLGAYVADLLDLLLIFGLALGMVTDLLTNNALRFFAKSEGAYDRWMMFPEKKYSTFFLNMLYSLVLLFFVYLWYGVINMLLSGLTGAADTVPLGVGPILFGLFYACFDVLCVRMRQLLLQIVADAKASVRNR